MVVGALDVHDFVKTAFPLGDVVGHVGHKVGVAAIRLAHHTVLVVAVVGGLEPERAVLLVGLAGLLQALHRRLHLAAGVKTRFEVVVVKLDVERLQVEVLFAAQVGHSEHADRVQIVHVATGSEFTVVGADGLLRQKVGGDVGNVVAVVGRGVVAARPLRIAGLEALGAQLGRGRQRGDLDTRVVVVELAPDVPALRLKQVADGVAQCRLPTMAHVQRASRVGRDKLHQHPLLARGAAAKAHALGQHFAHDFLLGGGFQLDVDEARAGNIDRLDPARVGRRLQQRGAQVVSQLPRVLLERLGQLHGGGAGQIAMRGDLGRFERGFFTGAGGNQFQLDRERGEQFLFDGEHGWILRAGARAARRQRHGRTAAPFAQPGASAAAAFQKSGWL